MATVSTRRSDYCVFLYTGIEMNTFPKNAECIFERSTAQEAKPLTLSCLSTCVSSRMTASNINIWAKIKGFSVYLMNVTKMYSRFYK